MTDNDYSRIQVGDTPIGLRGLKGAVEELAQSHADKTDGEVAQALLERLSVKNYIAASARDEYGVALVREFRKALRQPYKEAPRASLSIVVVGPGCSQCDRLEQTVKQVLSEMALPAAVEHVTDIKEMSRYGFVRTPALVINDKVVAMGTVPSSKKIKEMLAEARGSVAG